jgi:general secretion pathway protein B
MSYILEALKKSEQQRKQGDVPSLQTVHPPMPEQPTSASWPYLVIVVLLVSLAFVLGWMQPWNDRGPLESVARQQAQPAVQASVAATLSTPTDAVSADTPALAMQPSAELAGLPPPAAAASAVPERPSLDMGSVPHLSEMPELVRQAIPQMKFAGHVYSSSAEQRSVIINGRSMSEGETVIAGLLVEQITRDGIVFNYRGQLFRMQILQDWSFDY